MADVLGPGGIMELGEEEIIHKYSSLGEQPAFQTNGQKYRVYKRSPFGLTLRELCGHSRNFGDRDFLVYEDERLTFEQTFAQVDAITAALVNKYGVVKGDRVAVSSRNYPEWCIAFLAAACAGAIVVPVNSLWNGEELEYGMNDSGTKVLFCDQERLDLIVPLLGDKCPGLSAVVAIRTNPVSHAMVDSYADVLAANAGAALPDVEVEQDDDATLFYTSGTTGNPKGTLSTHRAVMSAVNTLGVRVAMKHAAGQGGIYESQQGCGLCSVPLFHVTGSHAIFLSAVLQGSKLVLMYKWDVVTALEHIQNEGVTGFTGVPTMWLDLVSHPDYDKYDTSTLKSIGGGGAAPPKKAGSDVAKKGVSPGQGWGMTETNAITVSISGTAYLERPGSCGQPNHLWDLRILDEEGNVLPPETPGLLQCRGVGLMKEYWNNRQATLDNIDNDGWLDTGDIARIDEEGYLYIMDRAKDLIIRGGENISCAEVESAVYDHPAVKEATSFGMKEERLGEEVAVAITPKDGETIDPAEFIAFVSGRIAKFKVPTRVFIWPSDLPRGATGKIPKRDVRDDVEEGKTAGVVELNLAAAKL